jgi:hypothetical protein
VTTPRTRRRNVRAVLAAGLILLGVTPAALAARAPADEGAIANGADTHGHNHAQHGTEGGHLPPVSRGGLELVGRMRINQDQTGRASDVSVLGNHAYIGAFAEPRCQKGGVYVFDISNPEKPKQVNFIRTGGNSYVGEGVQVVNITTPRFSGDVLVMNNEICGPDQPSTVGGVTFVDVTDPKRHRYLAKGVGDVDEVTGLVHTSHSAFMWDAGDTAYAVIIDNEETADLDILDITDPRAPVLIAEYDLNADFPGIIDAVKGRAESFSHDMVVQQVGDRWHMLASYWDGGYVVLDVTDPRNPTLVGDTDFAPVDPVLLAATGDSRAPEGNAHQAEWTSDGRYFVGADEDFSPYGATATAGGIAFVGATPGSNTPGLPVGTPVTGTAVFVGRACNGDPIHSAASGSIAVAERGECAFSEKVANIEAAGDPSVIVIFNRTGSDGGCNATLPMSVAGSTPTLGVVPRSTGLGWFGASYDDAVCQDGDGTQLAAITLGTAGPSMRFESYFDGWGYVRLFGNTPVSGKYPLLDTYAIPEAHDPDYATGFGDLSVHEVATSPSDASLLYFAYYSGGVRVVRIENDRLVEKAAWIAPGGSNIWGVEVWTPTSGPYAGQELLLASDRDYGLLVFRYTGD